MIRAVTKIVGLAALNSLLLLAVWYVTRYLSEPPRGVSYGIGMYYIWIFLSIQCLISLILMHVLSLKTAAFLTAGMICGIAAFFFQGGIFRHYIPMLGATTLFCVVTFVVHWRRSHKFAPIA